MCNVSRRNRKSLAELRNMLGFAIAVYVLPQTRLKWFGHVEGVVIENPVGNFRFIGVDNQRGRGRQCKTWTHLIKDDLRKLRLQLGFT